MRKFRNTIIICVVAAVVVCLGGCTTYDNFKGAFIDKTKKDVAKIQIGVLEPVTGADSVNAAEEIRGIQLANKVHPSVNGKMISLMFADNKSDIDATETAVQTLIEKEPMVILGSYGSVYSLAAAAYINEAEIPAISVTNNNPLVTRNNDFYFRVCYVDSNQGDLLARYVLKSKHEKTAGVLIPENNDAATAKASAFTERIKGESGNADAISYYEKYSTGQKDFSAQLKRLKTAGIKSVILPGEYTDAANIINQAADMGLDVQFLGDTAWGDEKFRSLLHSNVKPYQMAFVQFFSAEGAVEGEAMTKERSKFLDAYAEEYGIDSEPSDAMALGYDAYFVAVDAIDKAPDDASSVQIKEILANPQYTFEGASGHINFNSVGDPIKTAYITTWEGRKMKAVYTVEAQK